MRRFLTQIRSSMAVTGRILAGGALLIWITQAPALAAQERPRLALTPEGVAQIHAELGTVPLFDRTLERVKAEIDAEIAAGIDTPVPRDFSGGYTHQRHKQNGFALQKAGALFQILQDERYAVYVRDMLLQYEAIYKDLPLHPQERSYARGKLFWQCLNDANWLVYASQAYDAIYDWLEPEQRQRLNRNLFRPFADFLSVGNPQFFNRIHNHSTWGTAAVGMIGLVMDDDELVNRALYGIDGANLSTEARDDDGGFIRVEGEAAGFLANLAGPFSPDGYYTEGPYYQRYAMLPFLTFAQALNNTRPELKIFEYNNRVLLKGVDAMLNLTDADGDFFPLNDAQKGMSYLARDVVTAVDIAYHVGGQNPELVSIAQSQGQVLLDNAGFSVALASRDGRVAPFNKRSINLRDGADGEQGGLAVLRSGQQELLFKYTSQGLSHGHYDKLSYSLYHAGEEVVQDYGMVRFVNIEQKGGGNYLPENNRWAKQSIAHNTLVVNERSHFNGDYAVGSRHHSDLHFFDASREGLKVVSARERNAYPGVALWRTMALLQPPGFEAPLVLDLLSVEAGEKNRYDLPVYYLGQLIDSSFDLRAPDRQQDLGDAHGYEYLFPEAVGRSSNGTASITWLRQGMFHSLTTTALAGDQLILARIGANDPALNLRRDPAFMLRRDDTASTVFASALETHGSYDPVTESAVNSRSRIAQLVVEYSSTAYLAVRLQDVSGKETLFIVAGDDRPDLEHRLETGGEVHEWSGPVHYLVGH